VADQTTQAAGLQRVDIVKWIATIVQLVGYGLTGLNVVPWNVLAFVIGIALWFAVGVMWKDRAIMVVHVGAFIALVTGYLNSCSSDATPRRLPPLLDSAPRRWRSERLQRSPRSGRGQTTPPRSSRA
jgi:hypothetical protein